MDTFFQFEKIRRSFKFKNVKPLPLPRSFVQHWNHNVCKTHQIDTKLEFIGTPPLFLERMPKVRDLTSQDESYVKGMRRKRSGKKRPRSSNRESLHKNHRQTLSSDDTKALPPVVQSPLSEKTTIRGSTSRSKMSTDNAIRVYDTPRGVAFDTRCPDTDDGRKCSKEVLHLYSTFLRNIRDRGALPHVTVITEGSTKYMNSKNQENVTVQVHFKTAEEIQEELPTEGHFPFESSAIPVVHDTKENAVSASSGSAAKTAWKVLGNIGK